MNSAFIDQIALLLGTWAKELSTPSIFFRIVLAIVLAAFIGCERAGKRHSTGLRTFVLVTVTSTIVMILDIYLMGIYNYSIPLLSAATILASVILSGHSIVFSSRSQIKGITTATALWTCSVLGFVIGAGLYTIAIVIFICLLFILAVLPGMEIYLKNKSNHFEVHLELKDSNFLRDFVTVSRRLGLRIDDIELNQAYEGSGLSVYSITMTIVSSELKKYKTHREIIEALRSLDYIDHIEEMM